MQNNDLASNSLLLVEDDKELAQLTCDYLVSHGYQVSIVDNGKSAVERIISEQPALVILDVMLPELDGMDVCRQVRKQYSGPILMLTARTDQIDQILGLEIGADDYVCKPVEPRLLAARVKALLRRASNESDLDSAEDGHKITIAGITVDNGARSVWRGEDEIHLTNPEYELLWLLAKNAGHILSRQEIFEALRGINYDGQNRTVDINISRIRTKIGDDSIKPNLIKTVRNRGYMFVRC